jgi:cell division protein FtsI/penicillin-binding protein 2
MSALRITFAAGLVVCALFALSHAFLGNPGNAKAPHAPVGKTVGQDARLQAAAEAALKDRDGAIVVVDPQTGRVRSVVNQSVAFQSAFPLGSTIKPFTALAALRAGIITQNTRLRCRQKYKREDVVDTCAHPRNLPPFSPTEALAHSCNYYFATTGERLEGDSFATMLSDFGFGQITDSNSEGESAGVLARAKWQPESAIGEGEFLQATPIQLAMAYAALFNGGMLLTPALAPAPDFAPRIRKQVEIDENARAILLAGMRGAVTFGTAAKAELDSLPVYVAGKTGTFTPLHGFRSQGWFVGVAFPSAAATGAADAQLLVVVYLKNAHGAEAAEVAKSIFAAPATQSDSAYVT